MPAIPLIVQGGNLPLNYEPTAQEYAAAFLRRLRVLVDGSSVLLGSTDPGEPPFNTGPWLNNGTWYAWNDEKARYMPTLFNASTTQHQFRFNSDNLTAGRALSLQDKNGTVAHLLDVYVPRSTAFLSGFAPSVDWSASNMFMERLTGSTTISFSNISIGQKITVALINPGTNYTVSWPANVQWPGAVAPVQPVASAGENATGIYVFRQSSVTGASIIYGEAFQSSVPSLSVDPGGTEVAPSNYGLNPNGLPISPNPRTPYNLP